MLEAIEPFIKLPQSEEKQFADFIKKARKKHILPPKETTKAAMQSHANEIEILLKNNEISEAILRLRQFCYDEFLKEEARFNSDVLTEIGCKFDTPKKLLKIISENLQQYSMQSKDDFFNNVRCAFGEYAGNISPYIYALCLSNTQSRRSRAGKTFEGIIYFLYEYFNYTYDAQSTIGKKAFTDLKLGKVVDSILPSKHAFIDCRTKTIVGSMKTTLRERWQEVVEEITRSNLPNIYLLTIDNDISESKIQQMSQHNIILVVLKSVKNQDKLKRKQSVIDFETYITKEIPTIMNYWLSVEQ